LAAIALVSAPGGAGKTTLAICLATCLKVDGYNVAIVDMDPSGGLSLYLLGCERYDELEREKKTVADMFREVFFEEKKPDLENYIQKVKLGNNVIDLVSSGDRLSDVLGNIWFGGRFVNPGASLYRVLKESGLLDAYDVLLVDTIPFYEYRYTALAIAACDRYIVPTTPTRLDMERTVRMLRKLAPLSSDLRLGRGEFYSRFGVAFNKVRRGTKEGEMVEKGDLAQEVKNRVDKDIYVFESYIPFYADLARLHDRATINRIANTLVKTGKNEGGGKPGRYLREFYIEFLGWANVR